MASGASDLGSVTRGTEMYRGFVMDNVLHTPAGDDVHFHLLVPDVPGENGRYSLFVTLPGWQGLYFQGMGVNLYTEDFAFEAPSYRDGLIIAAPQLNDWGQTSADQAIALVEYLLDAYDIDSDRVYLEGYSGGGETLSLAAATRPDLFHAALHCSSQWDGDLARIAEARLPVRFSIGENDEYYGSGPVRRAHAELVALYEVEGLTSSEIAELAVLDVKPASYFAERNMSNQHGGGATMFSHDSEIMNWLFNR